MKTIYRILVCLCCCFGAGAYRANAQPLTLQEAADLLYRNNNDLRIADKALEIARAEKQKLNAFWYPNLNASGGYLHLSGPIRAETTVGELMEPHREEIGEILAALQEMLPSIDAGAIAGKIGSFGFGVPLLDRNLVAIDAAIVWPIFTGGKRIYAGRIGKSLVSAAGLLREISRENQFILLINRYYGYKLALEIIREREINFRAFDKLYRDAVKMEEAGIIARAEVLIAQAASENAFQELESARENGSTAAKALFTLFGQPDGIPSGSGVRRPEPVSDFFILPEHPPVERFTNIIQQNNKQLQLIEEQRNAAGNQHKIARSAYLPEIALFDKQTLYSKNLPANLAPRNILGIGFTWNLFDGLVRERNIGIARKNIEQLGYRHRQAELDLQLLADKLYSGMTDARNSLKTLQTTIQLGKELVRIREKSFAEGIATSTDVTEARALLSKARIGMLLAYYQYDTALAGLLALCGETDRFLEYARTGLPYR